MTNETNETNETNDLIGLPYRVTERTTDHTFNKAAPTRIDDDSILLYSSPRVWAHRSEDPDLGFSLSVGCSIEEHTGATAKADTLAMLSNLRTLLERAETEVRTWPETTAKDGP